MKRKDKTPPRSAKAVPLLICAAIFLTWAASMFCATLVAKGFAQERYDSANEVNASLIADRCFTARQAPVERDGKLRGQPVLGGGRPIRTHRRPQPRGAFTARPKACRYIPPQRCTTPTGSS